MNQRQKLEWCISSNGTQGLPATTKLSEARKDSSLEHLGEHGPADTLFSDGKPPELREIYLMF